MMIYSSIIRRISMYKVNVRRRDLFVVRIGITSSVDGMTDDKTRSRCHNIIIGVDLKTVINVVITTRWRHNAFNSF